MAAICAQQTPGFYGFSLERHVPDNHMLRRIDRFVDLSVRSGASRAALQRGRAGIRSERRLCEEVHLILPSSRPIVGDAISRCRPLPARPSIAIGALDVVRMTSFSARIT
jgi:hypothetical protein